MANARADSRNAARGVTGQEYAGCKRAPQFALRQKIHAIHAGHVHVRDHHGVGTTATKQLQAFGAAARGVYIESPLQQ